MLISILPALLCPVCRNADAPLRPTIFRESPDGHVIDGLLTCEDCGAWFPIQDELLELVVPSLRDETTLRRFHERFSSELSASPSPTSAVIRSISAE